MAQAAAIRRAVRGQPAAEQLAWLAARGRVTPIPMSIQGARPAYVFESNAGLQCCFGFDGDVLVIYGDNTTCLVEDE
jgi:hypothetical protein